MFVSREYIVSQLRVHVYYQTELRQFTKVSPVATPMNQGVYGRAFTVLSPDFPRRPIILH